MQKGNNMSLEKYQKIVAIPRLHEEFIGEEKDNAHIMVLDPTGQSPKAYAATSPFFWNKEYALQYLKDLQEDTNQLAKEKNASLLDTVSFQSQNTQGLSASEMQALQEFSGKKSEQNQEKMLLERAQRMLLIAYYNENLFLELAQLNKKLAKQQEILKSLLDENEHAVQSSYQVDDVLLSWKQILPAFLLYTQDVSAYFINDNAMAEEIAILAKKSIEEENFFCYYLDRDALMRFLGKDFAPYCKKNEYCFIAAKK